MCVCVCSPGKYTSMESLSRHPHQPHVVAVGRGDGSLCLKDLRQPKHSLQLLQAHSAEGKGWCPHLFGMVKLGGGVEGVVLNTPESKLRRIKNRLSTALLEFT